MGFLGGLAACDLVKVGIDGCWDRHPRIGQGGVLDSAMQILEIPLLVGFDAKSFAKGFEGLWTPGFLATLVPRNHELPVATILQIELAVRLEFRDLDRPVPPLSIHLHTLVNIDGFVRHVTILIPYVLISNTHPLKSFPWLFHRKFSNVGTNVGTSTGGNTDAL